MDARSKSSTVPPPYLYIIQSEAGKSIVEYISQAAPPEKGQVLNLQNITRNYGHVEVMNVEKMLEPDRQVVKVTVKPTV
jgi:hypothetical protein